MTGSGLPVPRRIFLSYGHDRYMEAAIRIKEDLAARGHEVWFDADRLTPGSDWEHHIEEGLRRVSEDRNTGRFLLLMTPHSVRRPDGFCLNELARAIALNLRIIPVMLSWCEPPLSICRTQWLDMQDCMPPAEHVDQYRKQLGLLIDAIESDAATFQGFQAILFNALKPLSFDAEIKQNLGHFTGRKWVFDAIEQWLSDPEAQRIFWITGNPGVGKTSISAWLCANGRDVSAFHFCRNDNAMKIDPRRCIMSLAYQLSTQLPDYAGRLHDVALNEMESLDARSLFDLLIIQPLSSIEHAGHTVVILIDALDEASIKGKNEIATFLSMEFERTPQWLRLIVTSRPDPEVMGSLQAYTPFRLDEAGRNRQDIFEYLRGELGKEVSDDVVNNIAEKCDGTFLYAEWVLKELKFKRLSLDRLDDFPIGLGGIYLKFFTRQFPQLSSWEALVRPALEAVAASRMPLQMRTLSALFGWNVHQERIFGKSMGSLFTIDSDGIRPFHKSVMEWLTNEEKQDPYFVSAAEGHKLLAAYAYKAYADNAWQDPLVKYAPDHLCMAKDNVRLLAVLKDIAFMRHLWEQDRFELLRQWTFIEAMAGMSMTGVYDGLSEDAPEIDVLAIADLLSGAFHFAEALKLYERLIERDRGAGGLKQLLDILDRRAEILILQGDYDDAMTLLKEQERTYRDMGDKAGLGSSLLKQANILLLRNDFDDAKKLLEEQERICRETGNKGDLQQSLNLQSLISRVRGQLEEAMSLLADQEHICREIGDMDGLAGSLLYQGIILRTKGDLDKAMATLKESEELSRKIGNKEYLHVSLDVQGVILRWRGDLGPALALHREAETISRDFGSRFGIQEALINQAVAYRLMGRLDQAMSVLRETQRSCEEIGNRWGLQYCIGQHALIICLLGDLDGAMALHKEEERICKEIGHKRDLALSLSHQAVILQMKRDTPGALCLHKEAETMLREIGYKYGLQECLGEKAKTLYDQGDLAAALACLKEQEAICRDMKLKPDLEKCLACQKAYASELESEELEVRALVK